MERQESRLLSEIGATEKQFDALYRRASRNLHLSDCSMWVLYYLHLSDEPLTQQELIEMMAFPKQTINSAVSSLSKSGTVELEMIPGTRNKKVIALTDAGMELVSSTVARMRSAEERAVASMGAEKLRQLSRLYGEFHKALEKSFEEEGIV
ncbi:MarR family winged helix-turn-helix transcriptional regulator [Curtanaerobium respiraculi]|uniref:MarR family winged helix-turn-helix transcriptional regulator n=1 Tax=Curtanaerobium respiraculi TaxID=2949669 RepID=UPI0024B32813|nr:MarR family transcriptional regulator [Curtanaerobium respiraculi]